jgi:hypothetical protein
MMTTGRAVTGGPTPPDVTNPASISGHSIPSVSALHLATTESSQAAPNAPQNGT